MVKVVYRLEVVKDENLIKQGVIDYLYDKDEDFFTKENYISAAIKYTSMVNGMFGTNYSYKVLFGDPVDIGWRYCSKCKNYYWKDNGCFIMDIKEIEAEEKQQTKWWEKVK